MICRLNKGTHSRLLHVLGGCRHGGLRRASAAAAVADFQGIPSPRGLPLVGTTLALVAAGGAPHLHHYVDRRHRQLGPIFKERIGPLEVVFLADPGLMRAVYAQEGKYPMHMLPEAWTLYNKTYGCSRGLFFMDGEEWLLHRRVMNKLLLKGETGWIEEACQAASVELVEGWEALRKQHEVLPRLEEDLYRCSLNTIVATLLGKDDYQRHKSELDPLLADLASKVNLVMETTSAFQILPAKLAKKLNLQAWKKFVRIVNNALDLANKLVNKLFAEIPNSDGLLTRMAMENLSQLQITRIVADLVLAAGDTTAYTMCWILFSLAKDSKLQENLRKNPSPTLLKNVIRETLRLYPVAPFLTRILPHNAVVGGYEIPAETLVVYSIYTCGRDPKIYSNPDVFWPDRWLRENTTIAMQQAAIPFGFGARFCIGKRIADGQLQALMTDVLRNFDLELHNKEDVEMVLNMVAVPSQPIRLKLRRI